MGLRDPMTAAEQIARRYYKDNHFDSQATAERAYFRILAEWLQRGRELARLSRRLGKARERGNCLARINADLRLQLGQAKVAGAARVDPSPQEPDVIEDDAITTWTPLYWASLNDDQKYEEYLRFRQRLYELKKAARVDPSLLAQPLENKDDQARVDEGVNRHGQDLPQPPTE